MLSRRFLQFGSGPDCYLAAKPVKRDVASQPGYDSEGRYHPPPAKPVNLGTDEEQTPWDIPQLQLAGEAKQVAEDETEAPAASQAGEPVPGRISAMAAVVWACPLNGWEIGSDDGCDPIDTGTPIKIHKRNVRPEYRHGPFALIEYTHEGETKIQYVKDSTVTPLGEDPPTIKSMWEDLVGKE